MSASGTTGPFRAFPKSLSVDFGGLNHPQQQSLPQSLSQPQQPGGVGQTTPVGSSNAQDRYAAVSHLDSVFSDTTTAGTKTFATLYFCFTKCQMEILYFLLHYMYLTDIITFKILILHKKNSCSQAFWLVTSYNKIKNKVFGFRPLVTFHMSREKTKCCFFFFPTIITSP